MPETIASCCSEPRRPRIDAGATSAMYAGAITEARRLGPDGLVLVNLSGRGDKDVDTAARWFGLVDDQGEAQPAADEDADDSTAQGVES